ncbi:MAG TPA: PH domain-containing protein [Tepidisphaeraceae bacterium]|nr:PH domain-containing protein [Tepidisphaeraceae bacterium]
MEKKLEQSALEATLDPDHVAPTGDDERIYFQGSPMLRGELLYTTAWISFGLIIAALPSLIWIFDFEDFKLWWLWPISIAIGAIVAAVPIIETKRIKYRISNYRIDREIGLLSKKIDTLELWHVEDIQFNQSVVDRILGVGTITIYTHDETTRTLNLQSLPNPRPIFDNLKNRIIAVKRQRGVLKINSGGGDLSS